MKKHSNETRETGMYVIPERQCNSTGRRVNTVEHNMHFNGRKHADVYILHVQLGYGQYVFIPKYTACSYAYIKQVYFCIITAFYY